MFTKLGFKTAYKNKNGLKNCQGIRKIKQDGFEKNGKYETN